MVFNVQYSEDHPFGGRSASDVLGISAPYDENRIRDLGITNTVDDPNSSLRITYMEVLCDEDHTTCTEMTLQKV